MIGSGGSRPAPPKPTRRFWAIGMMLSDQGSVKWLKDKSSRVPSSQKGNESQEGIEKSRGLTVEESRAAMMTPNNQEGVTARRSGQRRVVGTIRPSEKD